MGLFAVVHFWGLTNYKNALGIPHPMKFIKTTADEHLGLSAVYSFGGYYE